MNNAMTAARSWLPEGAMTGPGAASVITGTIGDWVKNWFAGAAALSVAPQWQRLPHAVEQDESWSPPRTVSPHLAMQCRGDLHDAIGKTLLPFLAPRNLHAKDRQLLQSVGDGIVADLTERLERFVAKLDGPAWSPVEGEAPARFFLTIEDQKGSGIIRLLADSALLVVLARRGVPKLKDTLPLAHRADALAGVSVECGALLGRANLSYREVRDLAVGDVLILDAHRDAAPDLLIEGKVAARGAVYFPIADTGTPLPITRTQ